MRLFLSMMLVAVSVRADVTIRYRSESSSPGSSPLSVTEITYMKGNRGATVSGSQTTIVDFGRQQVTLIDTKNRKYATIPAADYGKNLGDEVNAEIPNVPGVAEMLKSAKTACETKSSAPAEKIQGIQVVLREITCTTTMTMPDEMKSVMPGMSVKTMTRIWSAAPAERLRVPGLWQLSGVELWEKYFANTASLRGGMMPEAQKAMDDALPKDQSATLRTNVEVSMKMPMAGATGADLSIMKGSRELLSISTDLLDDSLFSVPGDCTAEPFADLMRALTQGGVAEAKAAKMDEAGLGIPPNVKAFVPVLFPLKQTEPVPPLDAGGEKIQGMVQVLVTIGPGGKVEAAEAISGPEALRKSAVETVQNWEYRPVIREGAPVTAYTEATVLFNDFSKRPAAGAKFEPSDMVDAEMRLSSLGEAFPRTPEVEFADLEQDAGGGDKERRAARLSDLALRASNLGLMDKAKGYAEELLAGAKDPKDWNYGNAIHAGHSVLGLVALRAGDNQMAREQLLEAGKTPGSPQLNSFGPNMVLASELLKKGDRETVLQYFELCRKFWKLGGSQLDSMRDTVRNGGTPAFNTNMPQ